MLKELYLRAFTIGDDFDEEYLRDIPAIKHLRQLNNYGKSPVDTSLAQDVPVPIVTVFL